MSILSFFTGGGKDKGSTLEKVEPSLDTKSIPEGIITVDMLGKIFGSAINETSAMKVEAFFSCIRDKAETIGQLPLKLYRSSNGGRQRVMQGRNYRLFTQRPCEYMSLQNFLEMLVACYERNGVFYAYLERNDRNEVMGIIPFANQHSVRPNMDINGRVYYTYTTNDNRPHLVVDPADMFIVSMFSIDGYIPVRPIIQCATLLGIAVSQEDSYKELQEKGITAQMAVTTEQVFKDPNAAQRLREDLQKTMGRTGASHIPIFEQGMKPISLKLTPQEAELLGHREFTVDRICRMTRVPRHRVGVSGDSGTKSTVSELDEAYMRDSLNPILVKAEHAFNTLLPDGYQVEFNRKAFYAGSPWRLVEAVEKEVKGGLASINEGRIDLGRETIEGGDIFAIDNNNVTYGLWTEVKEIQQQLYGQRNPSNEPKE